MKPSTLATIAALISAGALNQKPTPAELDALRERCRKAGLLELGHYLHESRTAEEQQIVFDELNKRHAFVEVEKKVKAAMRRDSV